MPSTAEIGVLRSCARAVAQERGAGLVEAIVLQSSSGESGRMIYKRLQGTGFVFTGMLWMPLGDDWLVWTMVAGERGTTGVREAIVTTDLFNAGLLSIESYEQSWARDPYDPTYAAVDARMLRYISDDDKFDSRFPEHPLTQVREVLTSLAAVRVP
jgi:hypothetical protein